MKVNFFVVYEGDSPSGGHKARRVTVGATDEDRWDEEIRLGANGADASTLVMFTVTRFLSQDWTDTEVAQFHIPPGQPERDDAFNAVSHLAEIAHQILEGKMTEEKAHETFFGVDVV